MMMSQLHHLWCLFVLGEYLSADSRKQKNTSCDVIKGHSYIIVSLGSVILVENIASKFSPNVL